MRASIQGFDVLHEQNPRTLAERGQHAVRIKVLNRSGSFRTGSNCG
jgi:hypothetical protein